MATKSVTRSIAFDHIPVIDSCLLEVRQGIDIAYALSEADCLSAAVQDLLFEATDEDQSIDGNVAWLCEFAMKTAKALREAAGAVG